MSVQQLQKLMIINKTKSLGWRIRVKSMFLTALTWTIWLSMGYLIYQYKQQILEHPVLDVYYIGEVILMMFGLVLLLMLCTVLWSSFTKKKRH